MLHNNDDEQEASEMDVEQTRITWSGKKMFYFF